MRALYFDGQAGAAGNMILGALIDLGVDPAAIIDILRPIVPGAFELQIERVSVHGISATRLTVKVTEDVAHRHLSQVVALLDQGMLSMTVRNRTAEVFQRLANAEAKVHSSTPEKVHFHEVGANDAIIDIVGSIWSLEHLGIEKVYCAPLVLGSGVGESAHGPIIYPAPAVLEILRNSPARHVADLGETTTPTGAAILAEVAQFTTDVHLTVERIGYGAGHRQMMDRPNLLRASLGVVDVTFEQDELWLGTSDIDNTRPEVFEWVEERLRAANAIDVVMSDISMKKGRQGRRIEVLCDSLRRGDMVAIVLSETGSLGMRWIPVTRTKLRRRLDTIQTQWGPIGVKVAATTDGERAIPEYDDCRAVASKFHVSLIQVIDTVTRLYYDQVRGTTPQQGE